MTLHEKIQKLAAEFVSGVIAAIRECSIDELTGASHVGSRRAAPSGDKPARKPGRLPRRSQEDIYKLADSIVALVAEKGAMRAEAIRQALGIDKKEWMRPLGVALASKRLKKTGEKRATEYSAGTAPAKKAKPKKAVKAKKAAPKKSKPKKSPRKPKAPPESGPAIGEDDDEIEGET